MAQQESLFKLTVPWGRQDIELQELPFEGSEVQLLRIRIREGKRFTIFDIDAVSAAAWANAMGHWAAAQLAGHGARTAD